MKKFKAETMDVKAMNQLRGGVTHDTTILISRKTRIKAMQVCDEKETEITGTVTIDRER